MQQHVWGVFDGCGAMGLAVWADALGAGHLDEAAGRLRAPVCAGPHLRHRRALAPLPDVKVRFPLAKLFSGEGAAADVLFILPVPGGSHPGALAWNCCSWRCWPAAARAARGMGVGLVRLRGWPTAAMAAASWPAQAARLLPAAALATSCTPHTSASWESTESTIMLNSAGARGPPPPPSSAQRARALLSASRASGVAVGARGARQVGGGVASDAKEFELGDGGGGLACEEEPRRLRQLPGGR